MCKVNNKNTLAILCAYIDSTVKVFVVKIIRKLPYSEIGSNIIQEV